MGDANKLELEWPALFKPIEGLKPGEHDLSVKKETIPIIFVPGIMGSRLKNNKGEKVWDPDAPIFMLRKYGMFWDTAAKKKKLLIGGNQFDETFLEPYADDTDHNEDKFEKDFPGAGERGWGTVAWSSYGKVLARLQSQAWSPAVTAAFDMPVYALGYNWSASNKTSGGKLKELIDALKKKYERCEHAVVVTHSMGGLVTASALFDHSAASSILGIVHGVMPATGSGAAYWRMKAGFERTDFMSRIAAWVLGSNGEEVVALLGNMPGGLQLLPSQEYTTNDGKKAWLQFADHDGKVLDSRPKTGDPYEEIYKNKTDYWRAVNPAFLDPGSKPGVDQTGGEAWNLYTRYVDWAKGFHQRVKMDREVPTSLFYGTGKKYLVADRVLYKSEEYGWKNVAGEWLKTSLRTSAMGAVFGPAGVMASLAIGGVTHSDWWTSRGGFKTRITKDGTSLEITLQAADGGGDGTVPESSGKAVKAKTAKAIEGIGHEPAYTYDSAEQPALTWVAQEIEKLCIEKIKKKVGG